MDAEVKVVGEISVAESGTPLERGAASILGSAVVVVVVVVVGSRIAVWGGGGICWLERVSIFILYFYLVW